MYPGNQSEKPYLRGMIKDTKSRYDIKGRVIHVADKGLNCAKNIYAATQEAKDGYIFSKSVHGRSLPEVERKWILLDNDVTPWINVKDSIGEIAYRYKECDILTTNSQTNLGKKSSSKSKRKELPHTTLLLRQSKKHKF